MVSNADFDGDGDVDIADQQTLSSNYGTGTGMTFADGDTDGDGDVDIEDLQTLSNAFTGSITWPDAQTPVTPADASLQLHTGANLCDFGHQGLMHDETVDLIDNRARFRSPTFGRFMQTDPHPAIYPDGQNRYAAHHVMRGGVDPTGMALYPESQNYTDKTGRVYRRVSYDIWEHEMPRQYLTEFEPWSNIEWELVHEEVGLERFGKLRTFDDTTCECVETVYMRKSRARLHQKVRTRKYQQLVHHVRQRVILRSMRDLNTDVVVAFIIGGTGGTAAQAGAAAGATTTAVSTTMVAGEDTLRDGVLEFGRLYKGIRWETLDSRLQAGEATETRERREKEYIPGLWQKEFRRWKVSGASDCPRQWFGPENLVIQIPAGSDQ